MKIKTGSKPPSRSLRAFAVDARGHVSDPREVTWGAYDAPEAGVILIDGFESGDISMWSANEDNQPKG